MCGDALLVAPIVRAGGEVEIALPPGGWYDLNTRQRFAGRQVMRYRAKLDQFPVSAAKATRCRSAAPCSTPARSTSPSRSSPCGCSASRRIRSTASRRHASTPTARAGSRCAPRAASTCSCSARDRRARAAHVGRDAGPSHARRHRRRARRHRARALRDARRAPRRAAVRGAPRVRSAIATLLAERARGASALAPRYVPYDRGVVRARRRRGRGLAPAARRAGAGRSPGSHQRAQRAHACSRTPATPARPASSPRWSRRRCRRA